MDKLLIIDKSPMNGKVIQHLLAKHTNVEYIGQANNGKHAMQLIKKLQPEIVFLSINYDDINDSLNLIPLIKTISKDIYIIILTKYYEFETIQTTLNYGACTYLLEPINANTFYSLLEDITVEINSNLSHSSNAQQYKKYQNAIQQIQSSSKDKINEIANDICNELLDSNNNDNDINLMIEHCKKFAASLFYTIDINYTGKDNNRDVLIILLETFSSKINDTKLIREIYDLLSGFIKDFNYLFNNEIQDLGIERITKAKRLITQDVESEISVTLESISQKMYISPYYLSRLFKKIEGVTFMDYLLNCRLDRAKVLLLTTNETIDEIAIHCGYTEPNSFRRMFRKKLGISPNDYRRSRK